MSFTSIASSSKDESVKLKRNCEGTLASIVFAEEELATDRARIVGESSAR